MPPQLGLGGCVRGDANEELLAAAAGPPRDGARGGVVVALQRDRSARHVAGLHDAPRRVAVLADEDVAEGVLHRHCHLRVGIHKLERKRRAAVRVRRGAALLLRGRHRGARLVERHDGHALLEAVLLDELRACIACGRGVSGARPPVSRHGDMRKRGPHRRGPW